MPTSSIDELLLGAKTQQHPETPENQSQETPEEIEEIETEEPESSGDFDYSSEEPKEDHTNDSESNEDEDEKQEENHPKEYDDYGNEKERMPKGMKERLDRNDRKYQQEVAQRDREIEQLRAQLAQQGASREVQQAAKDFEYNPEAQGDWQQQLAQFVKQTVHSMTREQEEAQVRQQEQQAHQEFETKFREGMNKFDDFKDVISGLSFEISNPMTIATRAMSDPAAFLYAAAKRQPQELERISKIRDPYVQMTEMGKLEERMRRNKPTTKAPRPLSRSNDDGAMPEPKKNKEPSIEELIAKADAKKLQRMKSRASVRR